MTDQERKEMEERDRIANEQADLEDIRTGRIKDVEHLRAVDTLLDVVCDFENSVTFVSQGDFELYDFINSKTMEELNGIFKRVREMQKEFDSMFELGCSIDSPDSDQTPNI